MRIIFINYISIAAFCLLTVGCGEFHAPALVEEKQVWNYVNYGELPLTDPDGRYQAVIEIPAGTNKKVEIDYESNSFVVDKRDGKDRVISFLPYPANYGFIAGTLSDKAEGGDGDAIDVFVIAEQLKTGTVISVEPVAMLKLIDDGEEDFKIIAVPTDAQMNILGTQAFDPENGRDKAILEIIEKWMLNYDTDPAKVLGWANKEETVQYIRKNLKR